MLLFIDPFEVWTWGDLLESIGRGDRTAKNYTTAAFILRGYPCWSAAWCSPAEGSGATRHA